LLRFVLMYSICNKSQGIGWRCIFPSIHYVNQLCFNRTLFCHLHGQYTVADLCQFSKLLWWYS
jgi:hypothetical protein